LQGILWGFNGILKLNANLRLETELNIHAAKKQKAVFMT